MSTEAVLVPDIGDYDQVEIIEVHVAVGDQVSAEDPLITLETDKATMDIPMPFDGTVSEMKVAVGDKVSQGAVILSASGGAAEAAPAKAEQKSEPAPAPAPAKSAPEKKAPPVPAKAPEPVAPAASGAVNASPAVRRIARELGIDLAVIAGTGKKGRITKEDLANRVQTGGSAGAGMNLLPDPVVDFNKFGATHEEPLARIRKLSAANLSRNWVRIPHITFFDDADITDLEAFRQANKDQVAKAGGKLTPLAFILKACAHVLKAFPDLNAAMSSDGERLIFREYYHIGFAADTPSGLVVPVVRDVDQKTLTELAIEIYELSMKAREGKLSAADMQGGCFTVSSVGNLGTKAFTPIINMPEVGILGVSQSQMQPVYDGSGGFVPRLMLPLSLSVDHRVIDGAQCAKILNLFCGVLSDMRRILL